MFNLSGKGDTLRGHWHLVMALVAAALATGLAVAAYAQVQDTTITLTNPKVEDALQYSTDLNFPGVADLSVRGSCPPANYSTTCDLTVTVAFDPPTSSLATRSISMKVLNTPFAQVAVGSGLNPGPKMQVVEGEDNSGFKYATVYPAFVASGTTWIFDFVVLNAPTVNGMAQLSIMLDIQASNTGFIGHSYDFQATAQFPAD